MVQKIKVDYKKKMKQLIEWVVKYTRERVGKLKLIIKKMKQLIEWIVKYTREWVEKLKLIIKKINKK
jgi:hypothetical protein